MRDGGGDDWWQVATVSAGPMYTYRLGAKSALDLKGMLGFFALTPVIDSYTSRDATGGGLGADLRATLRYDFARRWAVSAEGGVRFARVSFSSYRRRSRSRASRRGARLDVGVSIGWGADEREQGGVARRRRGFGNTAIAIFYGSIAQSSRAVVPTLSSEKPPAPDRRSQ